MQLQFITVVLAIALTALPAIAAAPTTAGEVLIAGGDGVRRCSPCPHPENTWFTGDHRGFSYTVLTSAEIYKPSEGIFVRAGDMGAKLAHPIATLLSSHAVLVSGWSVRGYTISPQIGRVLYDPAASRFLHARPAAPVCGEAAHEAMLWALSGEMELKISKSGQRELYQDGVVSGMPAGCTSDILNAVARVSRAVAPEGQADMLPDGTLLLSRPPANPGSAAVPAAAAEMYDPATGEFTQIGPMQASRAGYSVTQLKDGRLLIAGGRYCGRPFGCDPGTGTMLDSAEIYDPKTRRFTSTGTMATPRYHHMAVQLQDGRVLIAGGQGRDGESLTSAEIYDPSRGKFASTGAMTVPREHAAAILLH